MSREIEPAEVAPGRNAHRADNAAESVPRLAIVHDAGALSSAPASGGTPAPANQARHRTLRLLASGDAQDDAIYQHVRDRLVQFFAARDKLAGEELADSTLDRFVAKLSDEIATQVRCPIGYVLRFAHFIYLEHGKSEATRRNRLAALPSSEVTHMESAREALLRDERLALIERCLDELPPDERTLLLSYYRHDGKSRITSRQHMSPELGISPALLRTRISRLRRTFNQRVHTLAREAVLV